MSRIFDIIQVGKLVPIFYIILNIISSITCNDCVIAAVCNCIAVNESATGYGVLSPSFGTQVTFDICEQPAPPTPPKPNPPKPNHTLSTTEYKAKYVLNCSFVDVTNTKSPPDGPYQKDSLFLHLHHPCPSPAKDHSYSTGSILVIIFSTFLFSYLGIGMAVKFCLLGARGVEIIPNLGFWKDFPSLVKDGVKFLQNGCKASPSEFSSTTADSYDAI